MHLLEHRGARAYFNELTLIPFYRRSTRTLVQQANENDDLQLRSVYVLVFVLVFVCVCVYMSILIPVCRASFRLKVKHVFKIIMILQNNAKQTHHRHYPILIKSSFHFIFFLCFVYLYMNDSLHPSQPLASHISLS